METHNSRMKSMNCVFTNSCKIGSTRFILHVKKKFNVDYIVQNLLICTVQYKLIFNFINILATLLENPISISSYPHIPNI